MKVIHNDQEYKFVGYHGPKEATHFITTEGCMVPRNFREGIAGVAFFCLVPVRHTFGGIVFEETGEPRHILRDEWSLIGGIPTLKVTGGETAGKWVPVKAVEIVDDQD